MNDSPVGLTRSCQSSLVAAPHRNEEELGNARLPGGPRKGLLRVALCSLEPPSEVLSEEAAENQGNKEGDHNPSSQCFCHASRRPAPHSTLGPAAAPRAEQRGKPTSPPARPEPGFGLPTQPKPDKEKQRGGARRGSPAAPHFRL